MSQKPLLLSFPFEMKSPPSSSQYKRFNPPYLLHQMALKSHKPTTAKPNSSYQITPLIDDPRSKTSQRNRNENSFNFSALENKIRLLTKRVYSSQKSLIRSPKHLLSQMVSTKKIPLFERKKRDILLMTGGLNRTNLINLMYYNEGNSKKKNYYSLKLTANDHDFRNYKYKKPDGLCEQVFMTETIRSFHQKKTRKSISELENCIENLQSLKKREITEELKEFREKPKEIVRNIKKITDFYEETIEEMEKFLINPENIVRNKDKFPLDLSEIQQKDVFLSKNTPILSKEFAYLWTLSKRALKFFQKTNKINDKFSAINSEKSVFLGVFKHCFSGFKTQNSLINNRILLTFGLNPTDVFMILSIDKYFKIARFFYIMDHSQEELIDFSMNFLRINKDSEVEKGEFLRILKVLTEKIDMKYEDLAKRKTLFENFIENFYMTGILGKESNFVDFTKFRDVYRNYQMNIYDLIDLIFGRV